MESVEGEAAGVSKQGSGEREVKREGGDLQVTSSMAEEGGKQFVSKQGSGEREVNREGGDLQVTSSMAEEGGKQFVSKQGSGEPQVRREGGDLQVTSYMAEEGGKQGVGKRGRADHVKGKAEVLMSRRILPVADLTPYEMGWTIKGRVTRKGVLRSYTNARGPGHVLHIELMDDANTEIQACMFDDAATMFFDTFEVGRTYYISRGKVHPANKRYSRLKNDYELILNSGSFVEESKDEDAVVCRSTEGGYNFVPIAELTGYIGKRTLIDVVGIVRSVSSGVAIRRKSDNEEIPKREITIEDESNRSVRVSLWKDLALSEGELLLKLVNDAPVVTLTAVRVTEFLGLSLSTTNDTRMEINPENSKAERLRSWYNNHGKNVTCTPIGIGLPHHHIMPDSKAMYSDRVFLSDVILAHIDSEKPAYFNVKASISYIDPDQTLWYEACQMCAKKVIKQGEDQWCQTCQRIVPTHKRYVLFVKLADWSAEISVTAFNEEAEEILGHTANDLYEIKSQDVDDKIYRAELRKATWVPKLFRLSVVEAFYMNQKRRKTTIREVLPVNWNAECKILLAQIQNLKDSPPHVSIE